MRKTDDRQYKYYLPARLKGRLRQISQYPLTIVEAPSGFGKTTAVREYLRSELPHAQSKWYTCLGESAPMAWLGICELFAGINGEAADALRNLKVPAMDTIFYIASSLRSLNCQKETYLIIDNFQLLSCDIPRELINVFSMHGNEKLHIIFITQQISSRQQLSIHNDNIYTINASSFFFDREGISALFRMEGLRPAEQELEAILNGTEGWISAIRLQMINFKETGSLVYSAGIENLVETAIWNRLTKSEKDFLLTVSVLDSFTARQASAMMTGLTPDKIEEDLKTSDFVRYHPEKRLFIVHSILLDYLRSRFYHHQPQEYQNQIFKMAGAACAAEGQYFEAAKFFYRIKDFDAILSLPFSQEYLYSNKDRLTPEYLANFIRECPDVILCKHPFNLLILGYQAYSYGRMEVYKKICHLLSTVIRNEVELEKKELEEIKGEYTLLASLKDFNDIRKLKEGQMAAWDILGRPSKIVEPDSLWAYGAPSVLGMFWRDIGGLEQVIDELYESSSTSLRLTGGHGAGAKSVMRAEAMLMRGEDDEARILCYKALYDARSHRQTGIALSAELTLARIAILKGDAESYSTSVQNIKDYVKNSSNPYLVHMAEHCLSVIGLTLSMKEEAAPWLIDMESVKKAVFAPAVPLAQTLHARLLLMEKRYHELYGICRLSTDASFCATNVRYMMPRLYELIFLAVAKSNNNNFKEAREHLEEAISIALPDQIYLPFAEQEGMTELISALSLDRFDRARPLFLPSGDSAAAQQEKKRLKSLLELCKRQHKGAAAVKKALIQSKSPLTPREREIALMARDRMSAREISAKLYISETTVKTTLRNAYSKLEIHSRSELATREF